MQRILVAGASGGLGAHVVAELKQRGCWVRTLSRRREGIPPGVDEVFIGDVCHAPTLAGVCDGIDGVFSSVGASLSLKLVPRSGTFTEVDYLGNVHLLREAQAAGVQHFTYVSVFNTPKLARLEYVHAHEAFVEELRRSGMSHSVIRPTGFFASLGVMVGMVRLGMAPLIGSGAARTNPIHEADLAQVCAASFFEEPADKDIGGPDVLSRREIFELAFKAVGKKPRFVRLPGWVLDANVQAVAPVDARLAALLLFFKEVSLVDAIAPVAGTQRLDAFFREAVLDPVSD